MWKLLRNIFVFVVAIAMLLGGVYLLMAELFLAHRMFLRIVIAGIVLTAMGSGLLWKDFAGPLLGSKGVRGAD
jgi:hypothetical protein